MLDNPVTEFIKDDVLSRFMRYTQIATTSDPTSSSKPSSERQHDLLRLLAGELFELGLEDVQHASNGFVYATLSGNQGFVPFGLMAHVDTSPDQMGEGVKPLIRERYDGGVLSFPDDPLLTLSPSDCPQLADFVGDTIITASGGTLLGADDKAGVAEIMTALAAFARFPSLPRGRIEICFTTDEEIGKGVDGIDATRLPAHLYTMDGGYPGELETECFDAFGVTVVFHGSGVHPGYAFGKMINAVLAASSFVQALPPHERPETTAGRDGFFHISEIEGSNARNLERLDKVRDIARQLERETPGLRTEISHVHQYENMRAVLDQHPQVVARAQLAIEDSGIPVRRKAIRGGTDGSRLCAMGYPTPNIFAGGMLFHSRKEWIALSALVKAVETIVHLAARHAVP
jgi:tripeptide aminopeptidase